MTIFSVIPSEAAQRAAQSRDLFLSPKHKNRSLHCASLRSAPVGMTEFLIDWLREFFADHMDTADGEIVSTALHAVRAGFLAASETPLAAPRPPASQPEVAAFAAELLAGRQREALAIVTSCLDSGRGLVDIELNIIQPALYQIGEKWQANKVSVAQEHMASAIVQSVMTVALLRSPPPKLNGKRALLACVEGNSHTIGLRMVADAFQLAGWEVQYLGANVPTAALATTSCGMEFASCGRVGVLSAAVAKRQGYHRSA